MATVTRHLEVTGVSVSLTKEQAKSVYKLLTASSNQESVSIRSANCDWIWDLIDDLSAAASA